VSYSSCTMETKQLFICCLPAFMILVLPWRVYTYSAGSRNFLSWNQKF
jgi:hypothetical protein